MGRLEVVRHILLLVMLITPPIYSTHLKKKNKSRSPLSKSNKKGKSQDKSVSKISRSNTPKKLSDGHFKKNGILF